MSSTPLVSVVIPAYMAEGCIRDTLASVEAQTFRDFEVIVVDDASPDRTYDVVLAWVREVTECEPSLELDGVAFTGRYRVIRRPENGGPAAARNTGIEHARGEWVAFLDGDDAWLPQRLERQLAAAEQNPDAKLICSMTASFDGRVKSEDETGAVDADSREGEPDAGRVPVKDITGRGLAIRNIIATSSVLADRQTLETLGGFDTQFRGPEDYDLWIRFAACSRVIKVMSRLSRYRDVSGSLSNDDRRFLPQVLAVLEKAYAEGGALSSLGTQRKAIAFQHLSAAWMAMHRHACVRAWQLFLRGCCLWPGTFRPELDQPHMRLKLLAYLLRHSLRLPATKRRNHR